MNVVPLFKPQNKKPDKRKVTRKVQKFQAKQCDFSLLIAILLLALVGLVMITSSSYYYSYIRFNDSLRFMKKQTVWLLMSLAVLVFFMNYDYRKFKKWILPMYVISIVFLILVLFIGKEVKGSRRWLTIYGDLGFQPSELAKLVMTICMAYYLSIHKNKIKDFSFIMKALGILFIPVALIAAQNFSTSIVVLAIGFGLIFITGMRIKHLMWMILPMFIFVGIFILLPLLDIEALKPITDELSYRLDRITIWFDPWKDPTDKGFQTIQSLLAVGSGGLFGVGLGQSMQKRGFIPEAHNDIIFSIICEELGLFGAALVLILFLILVWRGTRVAMNAPDLFGSLLAAGAVIQVAVQVIINVAVNTNSMPVTGMPLPFISYGGSSLIFLMTSMGILLNVSRYAKSRA